MNRLYSIAEPAVINEDLITQAILDQGPQGEVGNIARKEGIDYPSVQNLRLDYKNILEVNNLWRFKSLVKLQLDNNIIEKIHGIEHLITLQSLDLSFNKIERIEGLEKLINIEDLSLFNNNISKLENLDTLTKIRLFSIGNNKISDLPNVRTYKIYLKLLYLRRFCSLRSLVAFGNPIFEQVDYYSYISAIIPQLTFLDYKLVDEVIRSSGFEKYQLLIDELAAGELLAKQCTEENQKSIAIYADHKAAFVEDLDGEQLFELIFTDDHEGKLFQTLPEKLLAASQSLFVYAIEEKQKRDDEIRAFWTCINDAKTANAMKGRKRISEFLEYKTQAIIELQSSKEVKDAEDKIKDYKREIDQLWNSLMKSEFILVDQLEDVIKDFERNVSEMIEQFLENMEGYMIQCRDSEASFHERLSEITGLTLEKIVRGEIEEEADDDLRMIFLDKDSLANALAVTHDTHLLHIDARTDTIVSQARAWLETLLTKVHQSQEVERNRARLSEINRFIDSQRDELENLDIPALN